MSGARQRARVLVAMSGGVDSAAAATLLLQDGYDVSGVTMRLLDAEQDADIEDARAMCARLGIAHRVVDLRDRFKEQVGEAYCAAYLRGDSPIPCVTCNKDIKFAAQHEVRREAGFDYLATGHYARRSFDEETGRWQLLRARDASKDQSYFLFNITQDQLAHTLFPLGVGTKDEVRALARDAGLRAAEKPESQDICFVPHGDYAAFIARMVDMGSGAAEVRDSAAGDASGAAEGIAESAVGAAEGDVGGVPHAHAAFEPGPIVDRAGIVRGEHPGLIHFTAGQRKGIGVAASEPLYVLEKRMDTRELVVGTACEARCGGVIAADANVVSVLPWQGSRPVQVKTHYRQQSQPATAELAGNTLRVAFATPQRVCAPGQAAAIYDGDVLLAGGSMTTCLP